MMMPSLFTENLFDDFFNDFDEDFFGKKNPLYGKHARNMMKTDVRDVGNMTRSFYLGDIPKEDIKAKYEGGVLRLSVPKSDMKQIENTSTIMIE